MDKAILKEALDEMRKEMRSRLGKKLLSIEVHSHAEEPAPEDGEDDADGSAQPDDGKDPEAVRKMGIPII